MKTRNLALILALMVSTLALADADKPVRYIDPDFFQQMLATRNSPVVSYDYQGEPTLLRQNLQRVAVELDASTNRVPLRSNRVLQRLGSVQDIDSPRPDYTRSRFVMQWTENDVTDSEQWETRAMALRSDPSVHAVWPVYLYSKDGAGVEVYCPGEITVKLAVGASTETLALAAGKKGLYLTTSSPLNTGIIMLRQKDPTGSDPFTLAAELAEESDLVDWAEPNLTQDYKFASNWVPWPPITPLEAFSGPADPGYAQQWHLPNANFPELWDDVMHRSWPFLETNTGYIYNNMRPLVIAIIDSGLDWFHEDIWPNLWRNPSEYHDETKPWDNIDNDWNGYVDDLIGWDFFDNNWDPQSSDPHGTACAGIAAARGFNARGGRGGAPFLAVMGLKISNDEGTTFASDAKIAEAITYAGMMADVTSCSWGGGAPSNAINEAIIHSLTFGRGGYRVNAVSRYAPFYRAAGTPVFFAAGNDGISGLLYPASNPWAIAVGATDRNDRRFPYSQRSANLDIVAPAGAYTTDITGAGGYAPGNYTTTFSGTSSATPLAASAAAMALAYQFKPLPPAYVFGQRTGMTGDHISLYCDPRFFTAGELAVAMIQGADKIQSAEAKYDYMGHSIHYGWGRLNAKRVYDNLLAQVDDPWQKTQSDPNDPSTVEAKVLRPGRHKWLLARAEPDYYRIPMEAGSSARITVTYLRHHWSEENTLPAPMKQEFGRFRDETTSPRLKVTWVPELDPFDPEVHPREFDNAGIPIYPRNTRTLRASPRVLEESIQTEIMWQTFKYYTPDFEIDWERTIPDRPYRNQDVSYFMIVTPLPQFMDVVNNNAFDESTYTPLVEYYVDFEYFPPPKPHRIETSDTPFGSIEQHAYGTTGFPFGVGRDLVWDLENEVLPPGTTEKSVSYSPEHLYQYPALTEPFHAGDIGLGGLARYIFPVEHRRKFNALAVHEPTLMNLMRMNVYDNFNNLANTSNYQTAPVEAIWDHQPARKDEYTLAVGHWSRGLPNKYFMGIHYSMVELAPGTNDAIEFAAPPSGELEYNYYPYERLNKANNYRKSYIVRLDANEGARVTVAQQETNLDYVWIWAYDEQGNQFTLSWDLEHGRTILLPAQDHPAVFTVVAELVTARAPTVPLPTDFRYQFAVSRYTRPPLHLPAAEPIPGVPDIIVESWGLNADLNQIYTDTELVIGYINLRNIGTGTMTTYSLKVWDDTGNIDMLGFMPPLPAGQVYELADIPMWQPSFPIPGEYTLRIEANEDQSVQELNYTNNRGQDIRIRVRVPGPNLIVLDEVSYTPTDPDDRDDITVTFDVMNNGNQDMQGGFRIRITDINNNVLFSRTDIPPLRAFQRLSSLGPVRANIGKLPAGINDIFIEVIANNPADDVDTFNNTHNFAIVVAESPPEPDLAILTEAVSHSPANPTDRDDIQVQLDVINIGKMNMQYGFNIQITDSHDNVLFSRTGLPALASGQRLSQMASVMAPIGKLPPGNNVIAIEVTADNTWDDLLPSNNRHTFTITVTPFPVPTGPNLSVPASSVRYTPANPTEKQPIRIHFDVVNVGNQAMQGGFRVEIRDGQDNVLGFPLTIPVGLGVGQRLSQLSQDFPDPFIDIGTLPQSSNLISIKAIANNLADDVDTYTSVYTFPLNVRLLNVEHWSSYR